MNIRQGFPEQVFLKVLSFLLQDDKTLIHKQYLQVPDISWIAGTNSSTAQH